MNLKDELNRILNSNLGRVEFNKVSSLLINVNNINYGLKNKLRSNIDLIITFAENKVTQKKYIDLLFALGESCSIHGKIDIAKELFNKIVEKKGDDFLNIRGYANLQLAIIESNQANWNNTKRNLGSALKIFTESNDKIGLAECGNLLGTIEAEKGKIKIAKLHLENAYANVKLKRINIIKTKIEVNLGNIYNMLEKYEEAEKFLLKALTTFENENEKKRIAETKHNLGMMYLKCGKYKQAIKEFESSLKISEVENFSKMIGVTYLSLGEAHLIMGDMKKALANAESGFETSIKINDRLTIADIYRVKGIIYTEGNKYETAENYLLTSLRINKELKNDMNSAETNFQLGILYEKMKERTKSRNNFNLALKYYYKFSCNKEIAKIEKHLN